MGGGDQEIERVHAGIRVSEAGGLAAASRENGVRGLIAYTIPSNTGMIRLFKSLPYHVKTHYEDGDLVLSCLFDELA